MVVAGFQSRCLSFFIVISCLFINHSYIPVLTNLWNHFHVLFSYRIILLTLQIQTGKWLSLIHKYEWIALVLYGCVSNTKTLISQLLLNEFRHFFFKYSLESILLTVKIWNLLAAVATEFSNKKDQRSVFLAVSTYKNHFCITILIGWK